MDAWKIFASVLALSSLVYAICWSAIRRQEASGAAFSRSAGGVTHGPTHSSGSGSLDTRHRTDPVGGGAAPHNGTRVQMEGALRRHVVLLTYYRGGSTFLGEIFAQNPDAFYWFEPLRGLLGNVYGDIGEYKPRVKHFLNMEEQYVRKSSDSFVELSHDVMVNRSRVLDAVLNCDVGALPSWLLRDSFVKEASHMPKMKPFSACLSFARTPANKQRCLAILSALCSLHPIRVLKTIRYPVYALDDLFAAVPDAYVIYYVRDPRGVMSSRKELHRFRSAHLSIFAQNLCDTMIRNHEHFARMRQRFPDRMAMLRYEDLAFSPRRTALSLYAFVGLAIPDEVLTWIQYNTAERQRNGPFATKRNSSQAAMSWKQNLDEREKELISDKCKDVLNLYGYSK